MRAFLCCHSALPAVKRASQHPQAHANISAAARHLHWYCALFLEHRAKYTQTNGHFPKMSMQGYMRRCSIKTYAAHALTFWLLQVIFQQ